MKSLHERGIEIGILHGASVDGIEQDLGTAPCGDECSGKLVALQRVEMGPEISEGGSGGVRIAGSDGSDGGSADGGSEAGIGSQRCDLRGVLGGKSGQGIDGE